MAVRGAAGENPAPEGVWVVDGGGPLAQTLGLKIIDGAVAAQANEILISRATAQTFFADRAAVGGTLTLPDVREPMTVAGVYEDVALVIPYLANGDLTILRPHPAGDERGTRYLVRVDPADRGSVIATLVRELRQADAQRAYDVRPFNLTQTRHVTTSSGLIQTLGIIALVLAAVALLGSLAITAFLVQQRTRQVGIRRALGATQWDIVHQFLIENGFAVALGCILGFAISLGYYFALGDVFPGVNLSAMQFLFTASLLFVDGALATLVPALRAARISPTTASRSL